jgi:hypothetical protein
MKDLRGGFVDVAGADCEEDIAGVQGVRSRAGGILDGPGVRDGRVLYLGRQCAGVHAGRWFLARRVRIGDEQQIGAFEAGAELVQ